MPISVSALQGLMQPPPELTEHWDLIRAAQTEHAMVGIVDQDFELPAGEENAALRVPVGDEFLHIAYKQALALRLASDVVLGADASPESYAHLIAATVVLWDLQEDDGKLWPLTPYRLTMLGKPVLVTLWETIRQAELDAAAATNSADGSG